MAELFEKQAKQYVDGRPSYPPQLFQFIASKTPSHHRAWDVATGNGQAAKSLAALYENVIATDASEKQLEFAEKISNVRYEYTPPTMSLAELEQIVAPQGTIDLVTIAQALHWFHLPTFYEQVKLVLKKPHGVIAAWRYDLPGFCDAVLDSILHQLYFFDLDPYWETKSRSVREKFLSFDFPFVPVDTDHTGPFEFVMETMMDLDSLFTYIRSLSAYQTAKEKGVEILREDVVEKFKLAWGEDGQKVARSPIYLRIGRVSD
ncbi:uncharacterized protein LOC130722909 [Lotus japonicus]|uniref:Methyltransferase type 11 domain-containing protein n=1 Tax=Lotus japonicus TaxID=34305 RepID=I3SDR5_LOTJA|nr:uncharacterized protein LOC130722909 [Lotus japonicus]AFK38407.1 unknown [Lotus japonicus]